MQTRHNQKRRIPTPAQLGCAVLLLLLLPACADVQDQQRPQFGPQPEYGTITRIVARALPDRHINHMPMDNLVADRALRLYLNALDPDHTVFLQSDIDALESEQNTLDDRLLAGDVEFAYRVFALYKKRLADRVAHVATILENGFDLHKDETLVWDREDAPWPDDEAAQNDLWRKRIKNMYIGRVLAAEKAAERKAEQAESEPEKAEPEEDAPSRPAPQEAILKRYKNLLIRMQDSASESVLERYLSAFARSYDPHTEYKSPSTTEDWEIGMRLSLVGIGAYLTTEDGAAKIVRLIAGGPAQQDGRLKPNDKIIAVAQGDEEPVDTLHWPLSQVVRLIRGEKGTKVVLTIIPASDPTESSTERIDLIRDVVKLEEQAAKSRLHELERPDERHRFGIVTLPAFYSDMKRRARNEKEYRSSTRDVQAILEAMATNDIDGLVLDLRNNGGGSLPESISLTGLFIETGPVVQVKERKTAVYYDEDKTITYAGPLLVLVNRNTASASEILTGALQDYGRALVVGDSHTHGKGTVQTLLPLTQLKINLPRRKNLGSLKITTASFHRITGASTQRDGVEPDIVIPSGYDRPEVGESSLPYALRCPTIKRVPYDTVAELSALVPMLERKTRDRRANDPRFQAQAALRKRGLELAAKKEISLNIDNRRKQAETEARLIEAQADESAEPEDPLGAQEPESQDEDEDGEKKLDLILEEAVNILADLIELQAGSAAAASEEPAPEPDPAAEPIPEPVPVF